MICQSLPQPSADDLASPTVLLLWRRDSALASSSPSRFLTGGPAERVPYPNLTGLSTWRVSASGRACEAAIPAVEWGSGLGQIL